MTCFDLVFACVHTVESLLMALRIMCETVAPLLMTIVYGRIDMIVGWISQSAYGASRDGPNIS